LESGVKIAAQCMISKYDIFVHRQRMCYKNLGYSLHWQAIYALKLFLVTT